MVEKRQRTSVRARSWQFAKDVAGRIRKNCQGEKKFMYWILKWRGKDKQSGQHTETTEKKGVNTPKKEMF